MPAIITVENLGKSYTLRHQGGNGAGYRRFSEDLIDLLKWPLRAFRPSGRGQRSDLRPPPSDVRPPTSDLRPPSSESFWALRNVSFEVQQGEVLGIIGRNGAGKSTLLKILSRITEPSEGRVRLKGRVASLLEVGTGFHPELTGRENIYLNGAVLGMSRQEIRSKFDEIVAFAEVEKFLDTAVKHYSSGMYVRLAFAVAAHLEPEILIVDEVLAVGDADFQKKCLGKMESVSRQDGRTVLFVSHNVPAIQQLTHRVVVLADGALMFNGSTDLGIEHYLSRIHREHTEIYDVCNAPRRIQGKMYAVIQRLWFPNSQSDFDFGEEIVFRALIRSIGELAAARLSVTVFRQDNSALGSVFANNTIAMSVGESTVVEARMCSTRLAPGTYSMVVAINFGGWPEPFVLHDVVFDVLHFEVKHPVNNGSGACPWMRDWGGIVFSDLSLRKVPPEIVQLPVG